MEEQIKQIPGYEGLYAISKDGTVFTMHSSKGMKIMKTQVGSVGVDSRRYPNVRLVNSEGGRTWSIHLLVARTFMGETPKGLLVLHRDDNRLNNHLSNLYFGTRKQNFDDSVRNGKAALGEKNGHSRIDDNQAAEIKNLLVKTELCYHAIALLTGATRSIVSKIATGERWKGIGDTPEFLELVKHPKKRPTTITQADMHIFGHLYAYYFLGFRSPEDM